MIDYKSKVLSEMSKYLSRILFLPTLAYNMIMARFGFRQWYNHVDQNVILGALPFTSISKKLTVEENVKGVVSLNENYEIRWLTPMKEGWAALGVKFLQLSTIDHFSAPSLDNLQEAVKFIRSFEKDSGLVYVHCKAGRTRSATVVACYLIEKNNWTPNEAVEYIRIKRPHILLRDIHYKVINDYYKRISTS